jgi:hypothetical protein
MSPEPVDANSLFRVISVTFKALVDNIDHALACVPADEQGGEEWQKLLRAREAAERGAELAARQLRTEH